MSPAVSLIDRPLLSVSTTFWPGLERNPVGSRDKRIPRRER
jgi:hypothetical protein